ncbi:MAG: restriction endonuclease subunit S [Methylococcaceae bacterium]
MSAIQQLLTDHIDIWTAADTAKKSGRGRSSGNAASVYGIKKLRELILELAVRGKLVPQDANDEPASDLLKRIQVEKVKLIAEGKIKKSKPLAEIRDYEKPFDLPHGWDWVRLGRIGNWGAGSTPLRSISSYYGGETPWFKSGELTADFIDTSEETITDLALKECSLRLNQPGDVLIAMYGATIGKTAILKVPGTTNQAVCACTPNTGIFNRYLLVLLKGMKSNFIGQGAGGAQPNISREKIIATIVAIPSTEEQHRIVAKVDELMALCDQLENQHSNAVEAHEKLVSYLLGTLTQSQSAEDFNTNWQRIAAHFDTLFNSETSIDALKQTLLQLAVMGKLVPQDPNDEPASELLKRIQAEKAKLIAEGKIKKSKPLAAITEEEKPFDLPLGWQWAHFPELGEFGRGKSKHRPRNDPKLFNPGIYPLVQTGEVARAINVISEYHSKYSDVGLAQSKMWPVGTLCITIAANIADSALLGFDACFPDSIVGFVPCDPLNDTKYLLAFMKTARENLLKFAPATAQKNINLEILESVLIPLPPLKEISRIVAKVDELMAICDQLKSRLTEANQLQQKLADVLVEQATA